MFEYIELYNIICRDERTGDGETWDQGPSFTRSKETVTRIKKKKKKKKKKKTTKSARLQDTPAKASLFTNKERKDSHSLNTWKVSN